MKKILVGIIKIQFLEFKAIPSAAIVNELKLQRQSLFFLLYFLLKNNCFTEFCYFLSNLNMNQL